MTLPRAHSGVVSRSVHSQAPLLELSPRPEDSWLGWREGLGLLSWEGGDGAASEQAGLSGGRRKSTGLGSEVSLWSGPSAMTAAVLSTFVPHSHPLWAPALDRESLSDPWAQGPGSEARVKDSQCGWRAWSGHLSWGSVCPQIGEGGWLFRGRAGEGGFEVSFEAWGDPLLGFKAAMQFWI